MPPVFYRTHFQKGCCRSRASRLTSLSCFNRNNDIYLGGWSSDPMRYSLCSVVAQRWLNIDAQSLMSEPWFVGKRGSLARDTPHLGHWIYMHWTGQPLGGRTIYKNGWKVPLNSDDSDTQGLQGCSGMWGFVLARLERQCWAGMATDGQCCFTEGSSRTPAWTDPWSRPWGKTRPSGQKSEPQSGCRGLWGQEAMFVIVPQAPEHNLVLVRTLPFTCTLQKFVSFSFCLTTPTLHPRPRQ